MYEMLTGKVPFDADTPVSVALKHIQEEPVPPIELNPEIPTAVNDIVLKAMKKDQTERYQSATEMLADLSKALKDPDGDFVIVENKDGAYTRIMNAVGDDTSKKSKKSKVNKFFNEHPRTKIMVAILSLVLLFVVVFLITKVALEGGFKSKVNIPDLTNKTQDEAQKIVDDLGLKLEEGEPQASSTVEAGKVISQDPKFENNKKIANGSTIKIILSKGPETAEMPNFVGENIETVKEKADEMGLLLDISETYSNDVDEGKVISQDVKSGRQVKSGDTIKIVVSKGAEKTTVPTVVDMEEGTAKATLSNAKLKANVTYANDSTKADGKVISQSVEQGKQVNINTTIDIVVNKIEVKESKVKIQLIVSVAGSALAKTDSENSNSVEQQVTKLTVPVVVSTDNGNQKLTKNITIDLTKANSNDNIFDLGEISGNGSKTIVIKGNISGKDVVMSSETINIDEYNGGHKIFDYTLNSL
jgi:serine/threonine-protein kinase